MIKYSDGKPRKMKSYMKFLSAVFSLVILYMVQEQTHRPVKRSSHGSLILSACAGRQESHWVLLCVLVKVTGCARGLSGLEEAWDWEEDIPVCDILTSEGKWQIQNTTVISQFNSRESKQSSHTSLVTGRGHSMSWQGGQYRSKGSMWTSSPLFAVT